MKTTWDELLRYAPEQEYSLPALERGEQERILNKTMKKLENTNRKPARPVRTALLAAAIAALLCGTAFDDPAAGKEILRVCRQLRRL